MTEEAHSSLLVVKQIRQCLQNQKYRNFIRKMAAVNDNPAKVDFRNADAAGQLPFFLREEAALEYLRTLG